MFYSNHVESGEVRTRLSFWSRFPSWIKTLNFFFYLELIRSPTLTTSPLKAWCTIFYCHFAGFWLSGENEYSDEICYDFLESSSSKLNIQSLTKWQKERKKIIRQDLGGHCKGEVSIFKFIVDSVVTEIVLCDIKLLWQFKIRILCAVTIQPIGPLQRKWHNTKKYISQGK